MKQLLFTLSIAALLAAPTGAFARGGHHSGGGYHYTHSYTTKRGTYVHAHYSTNPNHTKRDNWSTKGNVNPFTGKRGTKKP